MENRLYYVAADQHIQEMNEGFFELESKLQEIVEKNPELLSREWDDQPRKLFLIQREQEARAIEDAGNAFSLDHLLVDSEGIPVLVEVKRSTDTRIRREVVAQMLDYACRASSWEIEKLKASFRENNSGRPDAEALFDDAEFWNRISANLGAAHFRLVFVADRIPDTLRILIQFLDRVMTSIEVYGVELKPYRTADDKMLLSSSIVGNSLEARPKPTYLARQGTEWTCDSFLKQVAQLMDDAAAQSAAQLIDLCQALGFDLIFGKGATLANFTPKKDGVTVFQLSQLRNNSFVIALTYDELLKLPGCKDMAKDELAVRILRVFPDKADVDNMVKGSAIWIPIQCFSDPELLERFQALILSFL